MSDEVNLVRIEIVIRQAKAQQAKDMAEVCGPALKRFGGFALLIVLVPWQLARQALASLVS